MKPFDNAEYSAEWFNFARQDLSSAKFLLGHHPLPIEIICFLCQQTAEKCLKGLLVINNVRPPKIHNLLEICNLCTPLVSGIEEILPKCSVLNKYSVQPRYPYELPLNETDAKEAISYAEIVLAFTEAALPT